MGNNTSPVFCTNCSCSEYVILKSFQSANQKVKIDRVKCKRCSSIFKVNVRKLEEKTKLQDNKCSREMATKIVALITTKLGFERFEKLMRGEYAI